MRRYYADQAPAFPSGCLPFAYADSQQESLPVQRFSVSEAQRDVSDRTCVPLEGKMCASQHSRLRPRPDAGAKQTLPANTLSFGLTSYNTAATTEPVDHFPDFRGCPAYQGAAFSINALSQANSRMPAHCHSRYQHHTYSEQHQDSSQPLVTCEESWPWDDLLDSPGSDSFQSASTTYDPPSVDSVPTSFVSSTGSDQALLAPRLCNQLSCNTCQAAVQAESVIGASALPILVPKEASNSAVGYRQLGEASELRRVPRPRFRLANQRPTATRRSLLDDFDSVEDVCDDGSMHDDDYSCSVSSLIKAHVEPSYHQHQFQQPQQQLREWCLRRHSSHAGHQDGKFFAPVSHPVSFSDLDRQDSEASTDVVVAMGGMSIKKASQQNKQHHAPRSKSLQTTSSESGNADSMFAWLSRLLPGL